MNRENIRGCFTPSLLLFKAAYSGHDFTEFPDEGLLCNTQLHERLISTALTFWSHHQDCNTVIHCLSFHVVIKLQVCLCITSPCNCFLYGFCFHLM